MSARARVATLVLILFLGASTRCPAGAGTNSGCPFGINNGYSATLDQTGEFLRDLGVSWISDHVARRRIETRRPDGTVEYDFREVDDLIAEYGAEARCRAWFVINVETAYEFEDGLCSRWGKGSSRGKFIPHGPKSFEAYRRFLREMVRHVNGRVPGWKVLYWSIDNEHASLFLPAFCDRELSDLPRDAATQGADAAAAAYASVLIESARTIREVDPEAKIVFGGPGGGTPNLEYELYYQRCLARLKAREAEGGFDFFDYHNFNVYRGYATNARGKGLSDFRKALAEAGFPDKKILVKAGGTHTGVDRAAKNRRLKQPQTEAEQAEHLVKRFVHHAANGVPVILWGTIVEDGKEHGTFSRNGLVYDGRPVNRKGDPDAEAADPGRGIKKLAYYSMKFLIDRLKDADWTSARSVSSNTDGVFVYRVELGTDRPPVHIVWCDAQDEPKAPPRTIRLNVPTARFATVTALIPEGKSGADLDGKRFPDLFRTEKRSIVDGSLALELSRSPVLVEVAGSD